MELLVHSSTCNASYIYRAMIRFSNLAGFSRMVPSADNLFKLFDTLMVLMKERFEKDDFEENKQTKKKRMKNYPACEE